MQNPSQGVAQALQPHVHLISAHRFPHSATLNLDQAFRYLLDAPSIVKQIAPMAWHYITAPQDGTMWLEWLPHDQGVEKPFPSDGYVWGDPEATYRQDYNGYMVELKVHRVGYRPGHDQMASHARTRYHFLSKNPSVAAALPEPSLWIVHYHSSDPTQMMPAAQVPVSQQMQQTIAQRRWLEAQGRLDRREFMLHDRDHWPTLNIPGQMQQPQYGALAGMQNRYPQQHYPQQAGGPPAAKKARTSGPSVSLPPGVDSTHETTVEIEEDTALGDFFDHLTQRDISVARYSQHHRWMEEVFSSPYASNQIVPADLGLGLMGELKGLTDGILEPPNLDVTDRAEKPAKPKEADPFTNLKQEQVEEFSKRVEKHLQEGRAEIERIKAEHALKMQDWKKVKALMQAEKRLRYATWEGHDDQVSAFRLEEPAINGLTEGTEQESIEDVVRDVESLLKVKIASHQDANRIARGGLKDKKQPTFAYDLDTNQQEVLNGINEQPRMEPTAASTPGLDVSATNTSAFHQDPTTIPQSSEDLFATEQGDQSSSSNLNLSAPDQADSNPPAQDNMVGETLDDLPAMDMNDITMDGMDGIDMDIGDNNINFDDATHGLVNDTPDDTPSAHVTQPEIHAPEPVDTDAASSSLPAPTFTEPVAEPVHDVTSTEPEAQPQPPPPQPQPQPQPALPESEFAAESGLGDSSMAERAGDTGMYNDDDDENNQDMFEGLGNIENGDDALIDFDGGDMDDSAFGDALHGMDEPDGAGGS